MLGVRNFLMEELWRLVFLIILYLNIVLVLGCGRSIDKVRLELFNVSSRSFAAPSVCLLTHPECLLSFSSSVCKIQDYGPSAS